MSVFPLTTSACHCRVTTARYIDERSLCRIPWAYARLDEYNATLFRRFAAVAATRIRMQAMRSPQVHNCCACQQTAPVMMTTLSWIIRPTRLPKRRRQSPSHNAGTVCPVQALSVLLWSYGKAIPPAAESAMLLDAISDKVCELLAKGQSGCHVAAGKRHNSDLEHQHTKLSSC